ncbi:PIG-L family deacetylase [Candidatus Woesearchaeota archaeon]|jgi:N-acetylglucosamine malate deacetylase 1|nr:PIG-L family deacetylase [Candidatus Woesearchaeota archaeon]MBT3538438.1 PIG-L family deacetylase [Candidatus Woesearchaeota archaeon]MBT4697001.1 PIG-L family deacetylase [Candidatus Woesearchaeota archaeon]MBT7106106.1 PIG-L family deacetylase [Candidatus Woesearchaeota archaeon]MBT7930996.1 PIG-L family deacetylase [Candidatus Woesearchaeota archaeon]
MKVLVICAHPDDEVIGCGGTIAKHTKDGDEVYVCIVSEGVSGQYDHEGMIEERRKHANEVQKLLNIKKYFFFDFPDVKLDTIPQLEINKTIESVIQQVKPDIVYTHDGNDLNSDHQIVSNSTLVACRPLRAKFIKKILFYEIFGSTKQFNPNYYVDLTDDFDKKLTALSKYETEVDAQTRSLETIRKLAAFRGCEINTSLAEAFRIFREIK